MYGGLEHFTGILPHEKFPNMELLKQANVQCWWTGSITSC